MLTSAIMGCYGGGLKTSLPAFAPRQSVFFMPMAWTRAENIQYQPKHCKLAFSESTPLSFLTALLKKVYNMTSLSNIYQTYKDLHAQLKAAQNNGHSKVSEAICEAIVALDTAIAYLPIESAEDKKIKIQALKDRLCGWVTDFDGVVHLEELEGYQREQLVMLEQLAAE